MSHSKSENYIVTPHGRVHRSCYQKLCSDPDQPIDTRNTGFPPCKHPPRDLRSLAPLTPEGWIESAIFAPEVPLGSMCVEFTVPEPPVESGGLIYLFPGAQNSAMSTILQPVLQWGYNGDYGGDYWTVACWHATMDGHSVSSCPVDQSVDQPVPPGSTVTGTVRVVSCSEDACEWSVEAQVTGKDNESIGCTKLKLQNMPDLLLFLVAGALEAYPEEACCPTLNRYQYPAGGSTEFRITDLKDLAGHPLHVSWQKKLLRTDGTCVFDVNIAKDYKAVTLNY